MLNKFPIPHIEWLSISPMVVMAVAGMLTLLLDMYRPNKKNDVIAWTAGIGASVSLVVLLGMVGKDYLTAESMIYMDMLGIVGQIVVVASALLTIIFSEPYLREKRIPFGEFYSLILWAALGAMLMCSTRNLLMIFVGIEILSISLYVLAGMNRGVGKSEESSLKYFLLGAFATGFLLYGIAFIYGAAGSLDLGSFSTAMSRNIPEKRTLATMGLGFLLVGLGFKASLVPFHQWTPDVYQGTPTNVVAFMSTGGKVGVFVVLLQVAHACAATDNTMKMVFAVLALVTMTVGNLMAFIQKDVKRLLAYSSVANAGYVMVSIAAGASKTGPSFDALVYYMIGYMFTTLGIFAVVSLTADKGKEGTNVDDLRGLAQRSPFAAGALVVFVLSLIGIGPVSGFVGKFLIVGDALKTDLGWLAIALVLNSILGAFYYFGLLKAAFSPADENSPSFKVSTSHKSVFAICVLGVIGSVVFFSPMMAYLAAK
jgi:NADH-quinone oxidoreductase subunit N